MLSDDECRELVYGNRRCFHPLVGAARREDERCTLPVERFALACRYHLTEGEREASRLAFYAYQAGVRHGRATTDKDDLFPPPKPPRKRRMTKREAADYEDTRELLKDFTLTEAPSDANEYDGEQNA